MSIMQKGYSITIMLAVLTFGVVSLLLFWQILLLFDYVVLLLAVFVVLYCYDITPFAPKAGCRNHFGIAICKSGLQHS